MRRILLDTNTLIYAIDPTDQSPELIADAKIKLKSWLVDPNTKLAITPLIRFELLRSGKLTETRIKNIQAALQEFEEFEIRSQDAELAASLSRKAHAGAKLSKRNFDALHFASAVNNQLEIDTNDGDMATLKSFHEKQDHAKTH